MTEKLREYSIPAIRELLLAAFSAETLLRFCRDRPLFQPALVRFGPRHGLDDMVDEVIGYCQTQLLWAELLGEVQKANPRQYARFEDRLHEEPALAAAPSPPRARAPTKWPWEPPRPAWFWPSVGGAAVVMVVILVLVVWPTPPDPPSTPTPAPATRTPDPPPSPEPSEEPVVVSNMRGELCGRWLTSDLERVNLRLDGEPSWEASSQVSYNRVLRTDPPAGTQVARDSAVKVVCSLGPMRPVPNVVGLSKWYAQEDLENCDQEPCFKTRLEYERTGGLDEGYVIWTDPPAGAVVQPGSVVTLCLSLPLAEARVPDLTNMTVKEASARLAQSDLEVGEILTGSSPAVEKDRVIDSDPAAGETVDAGSRVNLMVSTGTGAVIVPNLVEQAWEAAVEELEGLGLRAVKSDEQYDDDILPGDVIATDPYADKSVVPGHEVELVVSLGLDPEGDRDDDGMPNGWEADHGLDPRVDDAASDKDSDGLTNFKEYKLGTEPTGADTDGDGLKDGEEGGLGADPTKPDTDGDGFRDGADPRPDYALGGGSGVIAYASERDGNTDIYLIKAAGVDPVRLTDHPARDFGPTWSPDGKQIAFVSERHGNGDIFVMDADGSNVRRLTYHNGGDTDPDWSPDGHRIAFESWRDGHGEIYVINLDGTGLANLTRNPSWDCMPSWSPAGDWIAFSSGRDGKPEIYRMDENGNQQTRLTSNGATDHVPAWSPDGSWIAFSSDRDGIKGLYLMRPEGSDQAWLAQAGIYSYPAWSPDGRLVAYVVHHADGTNDLRLVAADGSEIVRLTNRPGVDYFPAWQPEVSR